MITQYIKDVMHREYAQSGDSSFIQVYPESSRYRVRKIDWLDKKKKWGVIDPFGFIISLHKKYGKALNQAISRSHAE